MSDETRIQEREFASTFLCGALIGFLCGVGLGVIYIIVTF